MGMSNLKKVLIGGIAIVIFSTGSVQALTNEEILAEITALTKEIATLQAALQALTGTPSTAPVTSTPVSPISSQACLILPRDLKNGDEDATTGGSVSPLQKFLKNTGDFTYPEITGYFGTATESALQRYQARAGIVSSGTPASTGYGVAGPRTRARIQADTCTSPTTPITPTPSATACIIGTFTIQSGQSINLYSRESAPVGQTCFAYSKNRQCSNGVLLGDVAYKYTTCTTTVAKNCVVASTTVSHLDSRIFYNKSSLLSGDTCAKHALERKCTDGALSGLSSYSFPSCTDPLACTIDGVTVADTQSREFYFLQNIPTGESCSSYATTRKCTNGALSGDASYKYASCAPIPAGSCTMDNIILPTGSSTKLYSSSVAPAGTSCASISQTRSCTNGTLSGSASFNRANCSDKLSCSLNGVTISHASSSVFYKSQLVAFGTTCAAAAQTRLCTNADFSGSDDYKYASCAVAPPSSCALDGVVVLNGASGTFYKSATVPNGSSCITSNSASRPCSNGVLGGDAAYKYGSCTVSPPSGGGSGSGGGTVTCPYFGAPGCYGGGGGSPY